jgi:uncharacterized protein YcgI (DUF1989 family)
VGHNQALSRKGFWLTVFSRPWRNMPWFRPLATITEDTVGTDHSKGPARHHHIFGGHCNPWYWYVSAERDLLLAASLCPRGSGATEPSEQYRSAIRSRCKFSIPEWSPSRFPMNRCAPCLLPPLALE